MNRATFRKIFSATRKAFRAGSRPHNYVMGVSMRREDVDGYATAEHGGRWVVRHSTLNSFWCDAGVFEREMVEGRGGFGKPAKGYRRSTVQAMRNARLAAVFRPAWG